MVLEQNPLYSHDRYKFQHNADRLLELTKSAIGKSPKHFTIDELSTYRKFSKHVFGKYTQHHAHIHWKRDMNNNKMERFNGTFRDLKKSNTALIGGLILAEASKIKGNGLNK